MRTSIIIGTILLFGSAGVAMAETVARIHEISQETFVANCEDMNGEAIEGESFASCTLPSGTEVTCSFEPADAPIQGGLCEADVRTASANLKDLLGGMPASMDDRPVPQSLTSESSSSTDSVVVGGGSGGGKGGKGSYAGGGTGGSSTVGNTGGGPVVK